MKPFEWVAIAVVTVMSAARITRLITYDDFPPAMWVRDAWDRLTDNGPWALLFHCPYCMGFWVTIGVTLWGWLSGWHTAWWVTNSICGASYCAAIVMVHDGDD